MIKNIILASHGRHAEIIYFTFRLHFFFKGNPNHLLTIQAMQGRNPFYGQKNGKSENKRKITQVMTLYNVLLMNLIYVFTATYTSVFFN